MKFEDRIISFKPKPLKDDPEKLRELLLKKEKYVDSYGIKEDDFTDIYSIEEINKDKKENEELEKKWETENEEEIFFRNLSSIYEATIIDVIEANAFFGDDCEMIKTSKHDDYKNGIDAIAVLKKEGLRNYLGLGVDVTFSSDDNILEDKIESIKQCIRSGDLPSLKYFQDPDTGEHKKLSLPKIIIGSQLNSAEGLIRLWGGKSSDKNEKLKNHPVQSKIIMESLIQLRYFLDFAWNLSENTPDKNMAEKYKVILMEYGKMYNIIHDIYLSKKDLIESHLDEIKNDLVYKKLINIGNKK